MDHNLQAIKIVMPGIGVLLLSGINVAHDNTVNPVLW